MGARFTSRKAVGKHLGTLCLVIGLTILAPLANSSLTHAVDNDFTWSPIATGTDNYPYGSATTGDGKTSISVGQRVHISHDHGVTWQEVTSELPAGTYWYDTAVSADGMTMMVSDDDTQIAISNDGGVTWAIRSGVPTGIKSVVMSANGTKLALATADFIYTSSDSGYTWVQQAGSGSGAVGVAPQYNGLAMSSDGSRLIALSYPWSSTGSYLSTDSGVTWVRYDGSAALKLNGLRMSANGATATAISRSDSFMYTTRDGGATWEKPSLDLLYATNFISSDGATIVAFNSTSGMSSERYISHDQGLTWSTQAGTVPFAGSSCGASASANLTDLVMNDCYNVQTSQDSGQTWKLSIMQGNMWWAGAAASADGTKLIVTDADGSVYVSKDSGATWHQTTIMGGADYFGVASSADGSKLVVADDSSYIYISNDGGTTWVENVAAGSKKWYDLAMTPDGATLVALAKDDYIYISNDGGATWHAQTSIAQGKKWNTVAVSDNGQTIVAAEGRYDAGDIYVSNDGGTTWAEKTVGGGPTHWNDIAMSADGKTVIALDASKNALYVSKDSGNTWALNTGSGLSAVMYWDHAAMSADGSVILASDYSYKNVYVSTDGGLTWKQYNDLAEYYGSAGSSEVPVAMSADGKTLYVAAGNVLRGMLKATSVPPVSPPTPDSDAGHLAPDATAGGSTLASTGGVLSAPLIAGVGMLFMGVLAYRLYVSES